MSLSSPERVVWELLSGFARQNVAMTAIGAASMLVVPLQDVLLPHLTGRLLNAIRALQSARGNDAAGRGVLWAAVAFVAAVALVQVAFVGSDLNDARLLPAMQTFVRRSMLRCVVDSAPAHAHAGDVRSGELVTKFVKAPPSTTDWLMAFKSMVPNALVFVAATAYFAWLDPVLGAGVGVAVLAMAAIIVLNMRTCVAVSERREHAATAMHERIEELLRNLAAVQAGDQWDVELLALAGFESEFQELHRDTTTCSVLCRASLMLPTLAMVAFIVWRCFVLVRTGRLTAGSFVSVLIVVLYMMNTAVRLAHTCRDIVFYSGVIRAALDVLRCEGGASHDRDQDQDFAQAQDRDQTPPAYAAVVELRDVSFAWPGAASRQDNVLHRVSLRVWDGDRVAIVGRMGSGKTTLVRLLLAMLTPTDGTLLSGGRPYAELGARRVRRAFGYVPQSTTLFDRSVFENVVYGVDAAVDEDDVWRAAAALGVDAMLRELPDGLSTPVGKSGSRLSGGQRQAVWLLRTLLKRPQVLLLDEPTSAMDPDSKSAIAAALARFPARAVIFVSHDPAFVAAVATRVVVVRDGTLAEDG
jgi:ABC-type multidrug transport system fused ATPase/permease subunit